MNVSRFWSVDPRDHQVDDLDELEIDEDKRSSIILQYIDRYPESLAGANKEGNLPLHRIILNKSSNIDPLLILTIMERYPAALQHPNQISQLPLHIECKNQSRSFILAKFVELYPEALQVADKEGNLPLHSLLWNRSSKIDDSLLLTEKYPQALHYPDKNDQLPLHIECKNQCRSAVLLKCIELHPRALSEGDGDSYLPLHRLLLTASSTVEDALMMIDAYPAALKHQNRYGELPIHAECRYRSRSSIISKCIDLFPESLAMSNHAGSLPLHALLSESVSPIDIVALMMMEKNPAALIRKDLYDNLPIHLECRKNCRLSIISKCMDLYPELLAKADRSGCLPLHWLLRNESSTINATMKMIEKYPEASQHLNHDGDLPLHIECVQQCRLPILSKCIEIYPEALSVADRKGIPPLHRLLRNTLPSSDISRLMMNMEKYSAAFKSEDRHGNLPLHIECKNQCRLSVIFKLIELRPEALTDCDSDGYPPLHRLIQNKSALDIALRIIEKYPAVLKGKDRYGDLSIHLECQNLCRSAIVSKCIELYPESLIIADKEEYWPLHRLLMNDSSTIDAALLIIEACPTALQFKEIYPRRNLPLLIECKARCRVPVILKCIELYSEALSVADDEGFLPLHRLLKNQSSSIEDALTIIEKYPIALQHRGFLNNLAIHIECKYRCRSSIISKCIELYPESLAMVDHGGFPPLHRLLMNELSTIGDALMIIEKNPEVLYQRDRNYCLPIHIECKNRCRSAVMSKCMELYPEGLGNQGISIITEKINKHNFRTYSKFISMYFTAQPMNLYNRYMHVINKHDIIHNPYYRRRILNDLIPRHVFTPTHESDYRDLNWQPRAAMMMLLSQILQQQNRRQQQSANAAQPSITEDEVIINSSK
jgi:ankyrin repeat protein